MQLKHIGKIFTKNLLITQIILVGIIILFGSITFHIVEGWRILDSFYFIITTMSTIGFGDFVPKTDIGKSFFMFYAVIGVPLFVSIGGLLLENRFRKSIEQYLRKVYRDLKTAEDEIEQIEEAVLKKLKKNLESTKEVVETIQEEISESQKDQNTSRLKKLFKK